MLCGLPIRSCHYGLLRFVTNLQLIAVIKSIIQVNTVYPKKKGANASFTYRWFPLKEEDLTFRADMKSLRGIFKEDDTVLCYNRNSQQIRIFSAQLIICLRAIPNSQKIYWVVPKVLFILADKKNQKDGIYSSLHNFQMSYSKGSKKVLSL